jgi:type II secretory pathway pseudopilin PulG
VIYWRKIIKGGNCVMENKHGKNSKQKFVIIGVITAIIVIVAGYFIVRQVRINEAQKKVEEATANLRNTLNGGISNNGGNSTTQEAIDYINNSLVLENAVVDEFDTYYNTKVWGLSDIKVKNNGDKSITQITITVYFKDESGNTIGENNINIGIADIYNTVSALKPNYEWASEKDHYYELKNLSDNINPTRNEIKITNVRFE